ncbi:MAG TPA: WbuC family cupin fold metalloprotein [Thermoanaerobaculia bacterium]|nr:WbuC family cupin fold metalloprotein [Thermoanaerobaculia bacterium]
MVRLDRTALHRLSEEAASSPRLRMNRNLHLMEDPVHRLFNAIEPGSYIRPHRHLHPPKTETMVVVSGRLGFLSFRDGGAPDEKVVLDAAGAVFGVDVPAGVWHTFVSLAPGTIVFEAKAGPYAPPGERDAASWAPLEGDPAAVRLEAGWRGAFLQQGES